MNVDRTMTGYAEEAGLQNSRSVNEAEIGTQAAHELKRFLAMTIRRDMKLATQTLADFVQALTRIAGRVGAVHGVKDSCCYPQRNASGRAQRPASGVLNEIPIAEVGCEIRQAFAQ